MTEIDEKTTLTSDGTATINNSIHIASKIQADTLFNFTDKIDYIIESLIHKKLYPRYCTEDIRYLQINNIKKIAIPMKCFCDINLHRLAIHLEWYGYFGLAFSKEWGMRQAIQPVHYINPNSKLCADFTEAFNSALAIDTEVENEHQINMKDYLLHNLMYLKPYEGNAKNPSGIIEKKCFTDECEWRYIPDVSLSPGLAPIYFDEEILNDITLNRLSNALKNDESIGLPFNYSDIKYIIIKEESDLHTLINALKKLQKANQITEVDNYQLLSKVIIWETSKEDF